MKVSTCILYSYVLTRGEHIGVRFGSYWNRIEQINVRFSTWRTKHDDFRKKKFDQNQTFLVWFDSLEFRPKFRPVYWSIIKSISRQPNIEIYRFATQWYQFNKNNQAQTSKTKTSISHHQTLKYPIHTSMVIERKRRRSPSGHKRWRSQLVKLEVVAIERERDREVQLSKVDGDEAWSDRDVERTRHNRVEQIVV